MGVAHQFLTGMILQVIHLKILGNLCFINPYPECFGHFGQDSPYQNCGGDVGRGGYKLPKNLYFVIILGENLVNLSFPFFQVAKRFAKYDCPRYKDHKKQLVPASCSFARDLVGKNGHLLLIWSLLSTSKMIIHNLTTV